MFTGTAPTQALTTCTRAPNGGAGGGGGGNNPLGRAPNGPTGAALDWHVAG
jgi:hypothetical protein